jgi:3-methyladenine DNA glycosylase AlkD
MLKEIRKELKEKSNKEKAEIFQRFFKTKKGEYGEGDVFLGITVPELRRIVKENKAIEIEDVLQLLHSKIHEERFIALLIFIERFSKESEKIFDLYLKNLSWVNNWDLVDISAYRIIGEHLFDKEKTVIYNLARSKDLWERRVAIMSTFYFIRKNQFKDTINIAEILLYDDHDLIHKAVGWMLREIGKRDIKEEENFLKKNYKKMPRTMLRYAIEKFPEDKRKLYMKKD